MVWVIAAFLVAMSSVTSRSRHMEFNLTASNPNVTFKTPTFLRTHWARAYYSWWVSAPGNVAQLTVSCFVDIINSSRCSTASFSFYDYDDKIRICGRQHISTTLDGSSNYFEFKSSMCVNFNHKGASCIVSYKPADIPTSTTPVNPNCTCGEKGPPRIVGGNETGTNEYPWQAMLIKASSTSPFCGGSVIVKQWVLSASHCVKNRSPSSIIVVLGEHDLRKNSSSRQYFKVIEVIMHENYGQKIKFDNDIALLKLAKPVVAFNQHIAPICLPFNYKHFDFTHKTGTITGWGRTILGGDIHSSSKFLKQIHEKIIMPSKCTWLDGYWRSRREVTDNMICSLADMGSPNFGDSGGPLVWKNDSSGRYFQVGLFSFFSNRSDHIKPNVYTRVSQFVDWIVEKTGRGSEFCVKI